MPAMMIGSGRSGVTLVSVMVAVAIVGIALAMAMSAFVGASRATRSAADISAASGFAESVLEDVCARPFDAIADEDVSTGLPALPGASCRVRVTPRDPMLKEVVVTFSWNRDRPRSVKLATLAGGGTR